MTKNKNSRTKKKTHDSKQIFDTTRSRSKQALPKQYKETQQTAKGRDNLANYIISETRKTTQNIEQ